MKANLTIPFALVEYSQWHRVDPAEYAQALLDERGRELAPFAFALDPDEDERPERVIPRFQVS